MKTKELFDYDKYMLADIGGCDEVGRGPLAGPVTVCACVMPLDKMIDGVNDSKKISEPKREMLFRQLIKEAVCYRVESIENNLIDEMNILAATKLAMERAINGLDVKPDIMLIDAVSGLNISCAYRSVIHGDATSYNIAAASIIAKVTRDRYMMEADKLYPQYGFAKNKGYGTAEHIAALKKFGKCPIHRDSFIKNFVNT